MPLNSRKRQNTVLSYSNVCVKAALRVHWGWLTSNWEKMVSWGRQPSKNQSWSGRERLPDQLWLLCADSRGGRGLSWTPQSHAVRNITKLGRKRKVCPWLGLKSNKKSSMVRDNMSPGEIKGWHFKSVVMGTLPLGHKRNFTILN